MKKIEIELDQETYDKIQQLTQTNHCQISDLIKAMIEQLTQPEILNDSFIGKWSDDAELVDQLIEDILKHRT
ncbi:MAG: hypothetical protein ACKO3K_04975 [Cuspidothrix sp.]|uniref:Ribbon-helix-helix protein CopG domain-containing protein n=1 Tax=Dolichospermum compactum NIES-806 TaxID=1973481 RepID=A0A1Z4V4K5_9CYAN|nr:hypothetical protein [Dolichospermum compactum]BAZ86309.1 hypothetical protein NIES806_25200 [Dolichospermum compactum NIES-806]